jgi:hypothetical protein
MAVFLGGSADSSPRADTVKVDRGRFRAPRGVGARGLACMEVLGIRRAFHRQRALTGTQPIASRLERYRRAAASCDTRRFHHPATVESGITKYGDGDLNFV